MTPIGAYPAPPASLVRRLAALTYDSFLIVAIWMLSTLALVALEGQALAGPLYQAFLCLEAACFYLYFWRTTGQTLGMQAWRIKAVNEAGELMSLGEGWVRLFFAALSFACLGLGFLWMLFDRDRLAWHDRASGTFVIYLEKEAAKSRDRPSNR